MLSISLTARPSTVEASPAEARSARVASPDLADQPLGHLADHLADALGDLIGLAGERGTDRVGALRQRLGELVGARRELAADLDQPPVDEGGELWPLVKVSAISRVRSIKSG
jgi:hypothetical protein